MSDVVANSRYDAAYFDWQRRIGAFSAKANLFKFEPHVWPTDRVVDFGCGGGYLLAALTCAERRGIEVNPVARAEAERQGVACVASSEEIADGWADVVISNSALEHVEHPLDELELLLSKVRRGGKIVFSVPHESVDWAYAPGDHNQHLYTWSPMSLGNLFTTAGFVVERVTVSRMIWPPNYEAIYRGIGRVTSGDMHDVAFAAVCRAYRFARVVLNPIKPLGSLSSIVIVAKRPS